MKKNSPRVVLDTRNNTSEAINIKDVKVYSQYLSTVMVPIISVFFKDVIHSSVKM